MSKHPPAADPQESEGLRRGDRVRIDPATADSWLQPLRQFALEGRLGTVVSSQVMGFGGWTYSPVVEFDVKRKGAKPVRERFNQGRDLVLVERAAVPPGPPAP